MISDLVDKLFRNFTRGSEYPQIGPNYATYGAWPVRSGERFFTGLAATQYAGTSNKLDGATDLGRWDGPLGVFWPERGALGVFYSPCGGIGVSTGSIKSMRYPPGTKEYHPNTYYEAGDHVGVKGRLYLVPAAGCSSATWSPPLHSSGSVANGTLTFEYVEAPSTPYTFTAPIGISSLVLNDFEDLEAAWSAYGEAWRSPQGGTTYERESDCGNDGPLVVNFPCELQPAGVTGNYWTVAGGSKTSPANPTSFAYAVGEHQQPFATGFIVGTNAIMPGGHAFKLHAKAEHSVSWFNGSKQVVSMLYSLATSNAERIAAVFQNRMWALYCAGGLMASDESAAATGTAPTDRVRRIAFAGNGYAELRAQNIASAASDLLLSGGNGGYVRFGTRQPITGAMAVTGYIEIKDASGVIRKLAVIE